MGTLEPAEVRAIYMTTSGAWLLVDQKTGHDMLTQHRPQAGLLDLRI